jgi:thioredoxin reductase (NADPH)
MARAGRGPFYALGMQGSVPGVFAIGDVRSGSVKRVATAVGEDAQLVATLHTFLANAERPPSISRGSDQLNA